jgi:cobalt-zinc-cadmium efflux system protein
MLTDVAALAISITALRLARRPADRKRTFGYYRFEILAAALNASVLMVVAAYIFYEAYHRFANPPALDARGMIWVAVAGLLVNVVGARILASSARDNLNVKSAYLEVLADAVGSVGVIVAGVLVLYAGWTLADPIVAVAIGLWVVPRAWRLLKESLHILLEGVPAGVDLPAIQAALAGVRGVRDVHELHVWAIASGKTSLTAHLVIDADAVGEQAVLAEAVERLRRDFGITHTTVQVEQVHCGPAGEDCDFEGRPLAHGHHHHHAH